MGMYELTTSFNCPKFRSNITTTTFYTHRITSDDEYQQGRIDRHRHFTLHENAEKYEKINDCAKKIWRLLKNEES